MQIFLHELKNKLYERFREQGLMSSDTCSEATDIVEEALLELLGTDENVAILETLPYLLKAYRNIRRAGEKLSTDNYALLIKGLPSAMGKRVKVLENNLPSLMHDIARARLLSIRRQLAELEDDKRTLERLGQRHGSMTKQLEEINSKIITLEHTRLGVYHKFPQLSDMQKGD